jgi:hypothetical protein
MPCRAGGTADSAHASPLWPGRMPAGGLGVIFGSGAIGRVKGSGATVTAMWMGFDAWEGVLCPGRLASA